MMLSEPSVERTCAGVCKCMLERAIVMGPRNTQQKPRGMLTFNHVVCDLGAANSRIQRLQNVITHAQDTRIAAD